MSVETEAELNTAIGCYNAEAAGSYAIDVTQDITLTATTTPINNAQAASLQINGNAHFVDGADAFRIFKIEASTVTIDTITLQNGRDTTSNSECNDLACGGAVLVADGAVLTISHSTLSGNSADTAGGAILNDGTTTIDSCTLIGNTAKFGGGLYNFHNTTTIINSTVSGNTTSGNGDFGGGIFEDRGTTTVINSTINENSSGTGGGIMIVRGTVVLDNSIVANSPSGGDCDRLAAGTYTVSSSLDSDGSCGAATQSGSINLDALQDNGGPTQTHALLSGSDAINAGDNTICAAAPVNNLDQRGSSRPENGTCDAGAFEVLDVAPTITSDATASVLENQTSAIDVEATDSHDSEGDGLTFSQSGGADESLFNLDADTGVVTFITAPDFENPGDSGGDNDYDIQVTVTDSGGLTAMQDIVITVTDDAADTDTCLAGPVTIGPVTFFATEIHRSETTLTTSDAVIVSGGADVTFEAGENIHLDVGFSVADGGVFTAVNTAVVCRTQAAAPTRQPALPAGDGEVDDPSQETRTAQSADAVAPMPRFLPFDELPPWLQQQLDGLGVGSEDLSDIQSSAQGEAIVFATAAALIREDDNERSDVYYYRTHDETLWLVSRGENGGAGDGDSDQSRIDSRGEYVLYRSTANNLGQIPDTNRVADIYLADLIDGLTHRVSWTETGAETSTPSAHPNFGGDPLFVVYDRENGTSGQRGIYGFDFENGFSAVPISLEEASTGGLFDYHHPVTSADGRFIAYLEESGEICHVHFYDRDLGLHQRQPCRAGLAVASETATVQFSVDGHHVRWYNPELEVEAVVPNPLAGSAPDTFH